MTGFEGGVKRYPDKTVLTGTPVREAFIFTKKEDAKKALGIGDRPLIVSFWGSLGAREMNKKTAEFIAEEAKEERFFISRNWKLRLEMDADYIVRLGRPDNYPDWTREYIYDMPTVVARRFGDMPCRCFTTSEVVASATPVILCVTNGCRKHRKKNARARKSALHRRREKHCSARALPACTECLRQRTS